MGGELADQQEGPSVVFYGFKVAYLLLQLMDGQIKNSVNKRKRGEHVSEEATSLEIWGNRFSVVMECWSVYYMFHALLKKGDGSFCVKLATTTLGFINSPFFKRLLAKVSAPSQKKLTEGGVEKGSWVEWYSEIFCKQLSENTLGQFIIPHAQTVLGLIHRGISYAQLVANLSRFQGMNQYLVPTLQGVNIFYALYLARKKDGKKAQPKIAEKKLSEPQVKVGDANLVNEGREEEKGKAQEQEEKDQRHEVEEAVKQDHVETWASYGMFCVEKAFYGAADVGFSTFRFFKRNPTIKAIGCSAGGAAIIAVGGWVLKSSLESRSK